MARREKKPVHKVVMTEGKRNIIQQLLQEYDIETAEDIQDALKDLLGLIQCDETGTRVDGKTWWVHNASDALFTFLSINQKRVQIPAHLTTHSAKS